MRLLGLAASKTYRNIPKIDADKFSCNGNEISFEQLETQGIEGIFETVNAAGVLQVPVLISIWDDRWEFPFQVNIKLLKRTFLNF